MLLDPGTISGVPTMLLSHCFHPPTMPATAGGGQPHQLRNGDSVNQNRVNNGVLLFAGKT